MDTDRHWRNWGRHDPYYGVLSDERFRSGRLDDAARAEFFATGERHVERLFALVRAHLDPGFAPARALDFGCGVGRVTLPLARRVARTVGVDVAPAMLAEATANAATAPHDGLSFALSDDGLTAAPGPYDLVHSHVVLQHIPSRRGRALLAGLAARVAPGGVLAVQLPTACRAGPLRRALAAVRRRVPFANAAWNRWHGRPAGDPPMLITVYPLSDVVARLHGLGFSAVLALPDASAGADFDSALVVARRDAPTATG